MNPESTDLLYKLLAYWEKAVFYSSILALILAKAEHWATKWAPRALKPIQAISDAISEFGALNLRDRIAPRQWDGTDRRDKEGKDVG